MDAYTRHLHWLRTPDEIAEAAIEMTCGGVNPTIQAYPGHIDPTKVGTGAAGVREDDAEARPAREAGARRQRHRRQRAECRSDDRRDGAVRRHPLLDRHRQLRSDQADPAAARRDQAQGRAVREGESEARHDADVPHARRCELGRFRRLGSALRDEGLRSQTRRVPLGHRPHVASRQQHVGAADAHCRTVRGRHGLEGSHLGAEPRISR